MRRLGRILLAVVAVVVLAVAGVVGVVASGAVDGLLANVLAKVTGNSVVAAGLSGPIGRLHAEHFELRDAQGAWLAADDATLDWKPLQLVQKVAHVSLLKVGRVQILRQQASAPSTSSSSSSSSGLPVRIQVDHIDIARAEIAPALFGTAAALSVAGSLDLPSLQAGAAHLAIRDLDAGGTYDVDGTATDDRIDAKLAIAEPAGGLIAKTAKMPDLGALKIAAAINGPRTALATALDVAAGPLQAKAQGTVDLTGQNVDMQVDASAPAMSPGPDVAWQSVQLHARVHGKFDTPDAAGHLQIDGLTTAGAGVGHLAADLQGNAGQVSVHAVAEALRIPGPDPEVLAGSPLTLDAAVKLNDPARPATFAVSHALLSVTGQARTAEPQDVTADVKLARLDPFAALGGVDLHGSTDLHLHGTLQGSTTALDADGHISITSGISPAPALIGENATIGLTAQLTGSDLTVSRLELAGKTLRVSGHGSRTGDQLAAQVTAALSNLAAVAPSVTGAIQADASVKGTMDNLSLNGTLAGDVGASSVPRGPVKLAFALQGLPNTPSGTVDAQGTLEGAPLALALQASRAADGTLNATIEKADWRSLHAEGALRLPQGATLPLGQVQLRAGRLDDLAPFVGQKLAGSLTATAKLDPDAVNLQADARDLAAASARIGHAVLSARVTDPLKRPVVAANATLDGISASGVAGSVKLDVAGPQDALALRTSAALDLSGTPSQIAGSAVLNVPGQVVRLDSLQATARDQTVRLLAPATVKFGEAVAVDRLRIGLRDAVLDLSGQVSPRLNATATFRAPAQIAAIVAPDLAADGSITVDAKLTGTPAQPGGTIRAAATGLHMRTGPGRAFPPANLTATAQLAGGGARIDANATAGAAHFAVTGRAPLGAGALDLRANGSVDLAMLNPLISAQGRQVRGRLTLDGGVAGSLAAPRLSGTARLANGEVQDFSQGVRLTDISALLRADGNAVRIESLQAKAGQGTLAVSGTIGVLAPGLPLDLTVTARNARPLATDLLTADLDADLTLRGPALGLTAGGRVTVRRASIQIPERLPTSVVVLNVRRPGQAPAAAAGPAPVVNLNLDIDAPGQIFVRGHGVDAVLSGKLTVRGDSAHPRVGGGFDMQNGTFSLAGVSLTFTHGRVGFDGTGPTGKIDPTLDFEATDTIGTVTATLAVGGYASAPTIKLTSVPDLPQDEVLSYLLFRRSVKTISPFQVAEIAAALASFSGAGSGVTDPLASVRQGLGLDRLTVGSGSGSSSSSTAATLEAGRYVANGVYVGAVQGTNGGSGAQVQIDIYKGLKLDTQVGTGGAAGNQVGLTYQFEY